MEKELKAGMWYLCKTDELPTFTKGKYYLIKSLTMYHVHIFDTYMGVKWFSYNDAEKYFDASYGYSDNPNLGLPDPFK